MSSTGSGRPHCVERLRTIAVVAFAAHDVERARRPLVYAGVIDLTAVEVVARVLVNARRAGLDMTLHDPVPELLELLRLTGLDDAVPTSQSR